jgi:hypothetical protein
MDKVEPAMALLGSFEMQSEVFLVLKIDLAQIAVTRSSVWIQMASEVAHKGLRYCFEWLVAERAQKACWRVDRLHATSSQHHVRFWLSGNALLPDLVLLRSVA